MNSRKGWRGEPREIVREDGEIVVIYPVGLFIKSIMLMEGEASPYDVYRLIKEYRERYVATRWKRYSYQYIQNMFYWLRRLGYIRLTRTEPAKAGRGMGSGAKLHPKHFYTLTDKGRVEEAGWLNPFRTLYPETYRKGREKARRRR